MAQALELVCVLLLLGSAQAQIPIQCANDVNQEAGECCPVFWGDGSPCGWASGRGSCRDIMVDKMASEQHENDTWQWESGDFRLRWPSYFFRRLCVCWGHYGGADCGECQYGWRGARCRERHVVVRHDLAAMTRCERQRFIRRLDASKYTLSQRYAIYASTSAKPGSPLTFRRATIYDITVYQHYICSKTVITTAQPNFAHRGSAFLGWHRMLLMHLEREIRNMTGDDSFYIPGWTWIGKAGCNVCTNELFGSNNADGNLSTASTFSSWRTYCIGDGVNQLDFGLVCPPVPGEPILRFNQPHEEYGGLPTWDDVRACLNLSNFDTPPYDFTAPYSFRNALEGYIDPQNPVGETRSMHNRVHFFCGGTMLNFFQSTNDPIFPSVHVTVDKIFEWWLRKNPGSHYPTGEVPYGHRAKDKMVPYIPLWENWELMRSCRYFGYNYNYYV